MKYHRAGLLQAQEARFLNCLLINQGSIVTHGELVAYVWRGAREPGDPFKMVHKYVWRLKGYGWPIQCMRGVGYVIPWTRADYHDRGQDQDQDEQRMAA